MKNSHLAAALAAWALTAGGAQAAVLTVCPAGGAPKGCDLVGDDAIQAAVDKAKEGDVIRLRAGTYVPRHTRDIPFYDVDEAIFIRAYVAVVDKSVRIEGEPGVVLDGKAGVPAAAFGVKGADLVLKSVAIRNFRYGEEEDDYYDGHGAYIIDSVAYLEGVSIDHFQKMGVSARGASTVIANGVRIADGHVGMFVRESAQLRLCNTTVRDNLVVGVGAAAQGSVQVQNSVVAGNPKGGFGFSGDATLAVTNSVIARNGAAGVSLTERARAVVGYSALVRNEMAVKADPAAIRLGPETAENDLPLVALDDLSPDVGLAADPAIHPRKGGVGRVGLQDIAGCRRA